MEEYETRVVGIARQEDEEQHAENFPIGRSGCLLPDPTLVHFGHIELGEIWLDDDDQSAGFCPCLATSLEDAVSLIPTSFMILRPFFRCRPQSQLHAVTASFTPYEQRCTVSTIRGPPPNCTSSARCHRRKHPPGVAYRGLATHTTGFEGHQLPVLPHRELYAEHGVDGFLSPEGFDLAWTQYQTMMLEKLNYMTFGTADATTTAKALVEKYGRSADKASLFNHASMASNNHIFFSCLSPKRTEPTSTFLTEIEESFSSLEALRTEMIESADAMFGPGFVWIVKDNTYGRMKLLCTYLAGSPLPRAHFRSQQIDMATQTTAVDSSQRFMTQPEPKNYAGSFGRHSRAAQNNQRAPGNYDGQPILCVNTWQHAYLRDYGIGGKRDYLQRWWDRIDWAVVENNAKAAGPEKNFPSFLSNSFKKNAARFR